MPARPNALPVLAEIWRGDILESVHHGAWVETDSKGTILTGAGDPNYVTTMRSAAKPLQAMALPALPGFSELKLRSDELAIGCASHPGEPRHAALAASVLALSGFLPDVLVCGPAGVPPSPLKHGCSGNHAIILLIARLLGAPLEGYHLPDHPAQNWIRTFVRDLTGIAQPLEAEDACGIPTYGLPLAAMARAFANLSGAIPEAMMELPELVGPPEHADVQIMQAFPGRIVAKTGAEGLLCLGLNGGERGMAIKIADGNPRALAAVALHALQAAGWITKDEYGRVAVAFLPASQFVSSTGRVAAELRIPG